MALYRTVITSAPLGFSVTREMHVGGSPSNPQFTVVDQFQTPDLSKPAPAAVFGKKSKRSLRARDWYRPCASVGCAEPATTAPESRL